ncbi:MAG: efflux RND transporter periplasmic adaptor subunit [Pseudomonadota bacterium]
MTSRTTNLTFLLSIVLLGLLAGCADQSTDDDAAAQTAETETAAEDSTTENGEDEDAPVIPVEVIDIERGDVFAAYTGAASLEAFDEATVVAKVGGEVRQILVEEGDRVKRGDVLARLDGDQLRLELEQSRANLAKLEQEYNRNLELHERGLVAASAFETTKFDLDALRAANKLAELQYRYTTIRAPIDGVVSQRDIKVGNTIAQNASTFRITALDPLVANLFVPEREFGRIAAEQQVKLSIDALPNETFDGVIARISPTVDAESGTFKATVEIEDDSGRLKPGMFGRFAVIYDRQVDALLLPQDALIETQSGKIVYIVDAGVAKRVGVTTGYSWENDVAVLDGLSDGARVVVVGQAALRDGSKVRVIGDPEPAQESDAGEPVGAVASVRN